MRRTHIGRSIIVNSIAVLLFIQLGLETRGIDLIGLNGTAATGTHPEPTAVVWLELPTPVQHALPSKVIHQRNLTFTPHVLAIQTGTTVDFPNEDRVFHNVFSFKDGKAFDLGIYPVGATRRVTFAVPGVTRLFCNIHPGMSAYIVAVDSPYFSAVNDDGRFAIPAIPPGTYKYHAWKPGRDIMTGSITVQQGSTLDVVWK
jgi:plastocyanin